MHSRPSCHNRVRKYRKMSEKIVSLLLDQHDKSRQNLLERFELDRSRSFRDGDVAESGCLVALFLAFQRFYGTEGWKDKSKPCSCCAISRAFGLQAVV